MKKGGANRARRTEAGIALLISIFILLLISVVAIALIVSSGTESALAGNYRSSTAVYYAALSGLEEARSRLLAPNPSSFRNTSPGFIPSSGVTMAIGSVAYVLNPSPDPSFNENQGNLLTLPQYQDTEYDSEFGAGALAAATGAGNVKTTPSVWNTGPLNAVNGNMAGPLYKWVRINPVSEISLKLDVDADGHADSPTPIYYGTSFSNSSAAGPQVLEITSLAVLPNGSQKLLQYLVTPVPLNLNFPAAVILDGNSPQFSAPTSSSFYVKGIDQGSVGTCIPSATPVHAIVYTDPSVTVSNNFEKPGNSQGIPVAYLGNYTGVATNPDIAPYPYTLPANLSTVGGLNTLVQNIEGSADVVINGNATQANLPAAMSASNPMTIVVNGDLTLSSWRSTGYGLLLVTGKFTYDPDASWSGIILVIGKGWMYSYQGSYTTTQIEGGVFLAKTVDASGNPLPASSPPISPFFNFTSPSAANGIYYSSCWIQAAMPNLSYKILSFHEIAQ